MNIEHYLGAEERVFAFFKKYEESGCRGPNNVWGQSFNMVHAAYNDGTLTEKLKNFGSSHDIVMGVNILDHESGRFIDIYKHINWQEKKFTELTNLDLIHLTLPKEFNLSGRIFNDKLVIPTTAYRLGYYAYIMSQALDDLNKRSVTLEIGAGFGMTSLIFKRLVKNNCYIIIDFGSTAILSSYLLIKMGYKVGLYGELPEWTDELTNEYDIIVVPPNYIEKFSDNSIDLAVNTASFTEMDAEYINYYMPQISRVAKKFYNDNHDKGNRVHFDAAVETNFLQNFDLVFKRETPINFDFPSLGVWGDHGQRWEESLYAKINNP